MQPYMRMKGSASGIDRQILMNETVMIKQSTLEFVELAINRLAEMMQKATYVGADL